jgi:sulfofructosephosphate aldolase
MTGVRGASAALDALRRPSGAFAMVALDQRESLRTMLELARGGDPGRTDVAEFKVQASRALSPHASAVLLDRETGLPGVIDAGALAPTAALLVAADRICQPRGEAVLTTGLDRAVFRDTRLVQQAAAWKLLVIWHPDRGRARRARLVASFLDACRDTGRPSVLEGIVRRPADVPSAAWDHASAVLAAARELGGYGPDLYKAEVPTHGTADRGTIVDASRAITDALPCPWVVLSNGVAPDAFDDAAGAACHGGASGFLAGRAIWTASLVAPDVEAHLRDVAAPRLAALAARIDAVVSRRHHPATEAIR